MSDAELWNRLVELYWVRNDVFNMIVQAFPDRVLAELLAYGQHKGDHTVGSALTLEALEEERANQRDGRWLEEGF